MCDKEERDAAVEVGGYVPPAMSESQLPGLEALGNLFFISSLNLTDVFALLAVLVKKFTKFLVLPFVVGVGAVSLSV